MVLASILAALTYPAPLPTLLIVYSVNNPKLAGSYSSVSSYLANGIDASGKLTSIVATLSDPIFRQAMIDGKIPEPKGDLTEKQAIEAGRKLATDYVFYIAAAPSATKLTAEGNLYRQGRSIWKDRQTVGMSIGSKNDEDGTALSIANTWRSKLLAGPFKDFAARPLIETAPPDPGVIKPPVENIIPAAPVIDWQGPIDAAIAKKDEWTAVSLAREAVDVAPEDLARRRVLCDVLVRVGKPTLAADEAASVASWAAAPSEWRVRAAKAFLAAGDSVRAREQLNEAVAREPEAPETRRMLAQIALVNLEPIVAIEHLDAAIQRDGNPDGYVLRAIARAMMGGTDGLTSDWQQARKETKFDAAERYGFAYQILDRVTTSDITETRDLLARCVVSRSDPKNSDLLDRLEKRIHSRIAYMTETGVPEKNRKSFDRFGLCQRVLVQTMQSISDYIGSGDVDMATEARINLGEALKQVNSAREQFQSE